MNGEYQWWLLAVVAAVAGGIFWLLRGTIPRREVDVETPELAAEARWISRRLQATGASTPADTVERILELHRTYLDEPPPGAPLETDLMPLPPGEPAISGASPMAGRRSETTFVAEREAERETNPAARRERARRRQQAQPGQRELPPAQYRETSSGG